MEAAAARVAVPGAEAAERAGVASVADTTPDKAPAVRTARAPLEPPRVALAEAKALAARHALAVPRRLPARAPVPEPKKALPNAAAAVAAAQRSGIIPSRRARPETNAPRRGATRNGPATLPHPGPTRPLSAPITKGHAMGLA